MCSRILNFRIPSFSSCSHHGFVSLIMAVAICVGGCKSYELIVKQKRTLANMMNAARYIQSIVDRDGHIQSSEIRDILSQTSGGLDEWGSPLIFAVREEPSFSVVIVSLGSDRKLDVEDIGEYFGAQEERVYGDLQRDIVIRDGTSITVASDK